MNKIAEVDIGGSFSSKFGNGLGFADLTSVILSNAVVIAGIIVFFLIAIGGFGIMLSAGQDNPEGAAKGKKMVTSAIGGFVLIFIAYWIVVIFEQVFKFKIFDSGI